MKKFGYWRKNYIIPNRKKCSNSKYEEGIDKIPDKKKELE